jgi:hypothetical protein
MIATAPQIKPPISIIQFAESIQAQSHGGGGPYSMAFAPIKQWTVIPAKMLATNAPKPHDFSSGLRASGEGVVSSFFFSTALAMFIGAIFSAVLGQPASSQAFFSIAKAD